MSLSKPYPIKPAIQMSTTMAINAKVGELIAAGEKVYHLGFGESRFPVHPKILNAFRENAPVHSYLPVVGLPQLRANIADYYRRKFHIEAEANRVIVGPGSKSLLFAALQALEGDLVLPAPSWVSYETQGHLTGKTVSWVKTRLEDNFCLTADVLETGLRSAREAGLSPGILILNTPYNPSGVTYLPRLLADLADVAKAEDIIVISDEIYGLTTYDHLPHASIAHYYPEGTIVTGGLSKHLSLGGWRLGVAITPFGDFGAELYRYMAAVASSIWTTVTAPVQYAAIVAYSNDPEIDEYVDTCTTIHSYVTRYLYQVLRDLNVPCPKPSGGFYLYPCFNAWQEQLAQKHDVHTSQDLAYFLLEEEHIATLPGSDFGDDPRNLCLRMATSYLYALNDDEAEAVINSYDNRQSPRQFLQEACPRVIEIGERLKAFVKGLS